MKKFSLIIFALGISVIFFSCKKEKSDPNYFTFKETTYPIKDAVLFDLNLGDETSGAKIMHILSFLSVNNQDTTVLIFTIVDSESNILGGNYPSIDQGNTEASRAIIPFALFSLSGISFQDETQYLTGAGGNIDIQVDGNDYDVSMNSISVGEYGDLFDSEPEGGDGDFGFVKNGEISGKYNGYVMKFESDLEFEKNIGSLKNRIIEKIKSKNSK